MSYGSNLKAGPPPKTNSNPGMIPSFEPIMMESPMPRSSSLKAGPPKITPIKSSRSEITMAYEDAMDQMENISAIDKTITNFDFFYNNKHT